ncbi:MAG: PIN domain-containing protein [Spirochaetes bacterium]|nr:MAG: PIN domain-containing protein [Spirochaetota bacterium]
MIVIDTSVWIEFLRNNPLFFPEVRLLLENRQVIGLEWIFGELMQGARNTREGDVINSYWTNLPKVDTAGVWIEAGRLFSEGNLFSKGIGLINCAIVIAARRAGAKVWTLDKKLNTFLGKKERYGLD